MEILLILLFTLYTIFVIILIFGWNRAIQIENRPISDLQPFISIVIPVRNEEHTIGNLLACLKNQTYPHFEIIVVNDHSEDSTKAVVMAAAKQTQQIKLIDLDVDTGKKAAISRAVEEARGEIILTTDGDCTMGENWLATIAKNFSEDAQFVFGLVRITPQQSTFGSLQSTEFASVIGVGVATNQLGLSTMCNGANLAFRKAVFKEVNGYEGNEHIPSGDDVFLLQKINAAYPDGVRFIPDSEAIVDTIPQKTLLDFTFQRVRWAGKWKVKTSFLAKSLAVFVFMINFIAISIPFLIVFGLIPVELAIGIFICRGTVDRIYLKKMSSYLSLAWKWREIILLQVIYPLYVVVIALAAGSRSFTWKGRKIYSGISQNAA